MALPNQELPKYKIQLPASKKNIEFRPFNVREEKILLLAMETGNSDNIVTALTQIFELCTFGVCKLNEMIQVDAEYLFIHLRNKALGEGIDVSHECNNCSYKTEMTLNLEDIKVLDAEKVDPNIQISENTIVTMSYPTLDKTIDLSDDADPLVSVAKCIESLTIGESVYHKEDTKLTDYVEYLNGLTQVQIDMLEAFFKTMPRIVFDLEYKCVKCETSNKIHLEGLNDFFE
jgi:hypothetical protein